ncbi:MAG TPA: primosomal protein N' [Myxococcota bacterium]|nr:primosomal protein N' [Myxococcota bacterium]
MSLPLFPSLESASPGVGVGRVARVALPLPLEEALDYAVPEALAQQVEAGRRVIVPLERRRATGVVVEVATRPHEAAEASRPLRAIERVVDAEPALPPDLLAALVAAARDTLTPIGLALAAALPAGSAPRHVRRPALTPRGHAALAHGGLPAALRAALEAAARGRRPAARNAKGRALWQQLERDGLVGERAHDEAPRARAAMESWFALATGVDPERAARELLSRAPKQAALLHRIASEGPLPSAALAREGALLRALGARGLVAREERAVARDVLGAPLEDLAAGARRPALTAEQAAALAPIVEAVTARRPEPFLLHGVTGSGKTEIYLRAVQATLASGRQALVLVPEITLTHQILARLRARFGDAALAVLHSGLRPGERVEQWQKLRRGETPIAVGARSALFAPLERLGLVVIDEEHDSAYKNEEGFRYHARDLAFRRCETARCPLVLGSATPSLETRYAAEGGRLRRLVLADRIAGRPLPAVEIVDLARERARAVRGRKLILTQPLRRALAETLAEGGQAILFLNRRGFSTRIQCFECGFAERCKHCDISLVFHAADEVLRCHYCGYETPPPAACSQCGAPESALLGIGTERVEEEVVARFPQARVGRLDRDTERRRGGSERVLRDLREGRLDVLVGTQMVAKGHDFPGVTLVGVVAADVGLHLPDFRAAERTFQLLTQVAGRAGRGNVPGRVVVQTFVPDHYAIRPVASHDYEAFYAEEIAHRRSLGYPPCGRLAVALVSAPDAAAAEAAACRLAARAKDEPAARLASQAPGALEVLGPAPAPLARLRDRYRFHVLLRSADAGAVRGAAQALVREAAALPRSVRAHVDVNPIHLL